MRLVPHLLFRFFDSEWYESLDRYQPTDELLCVARSVIPPTWQLRRNSKWFYLSPPEVKLPHQGWKIHISATVTNCEEVLRSVAMICRERETAFKFTIDRFLVHLMATKAWSRESAGKFITIYPLNEQHFRELLEELYTALRGVVGPYILSDRRYKDSRVIYYRYGGISSIRVLSHNGEQQHMLTTPDGSLIRDKRVPYWNPPSWVSDDLYVPESSDDENAEPVLKDGRYLIEQVLSFSVNGGVYLALDRTTGSSVVIKEARPATGVNNANQDAVDQLRKEHRLLQKLQDTGITPVPIDLFEDWENLFLVEEYVPGLDLAIYTVTTNPLFKLYPSEAEKKAYLEMMRTIWLKLAHGLAIMHERGIVYGDLSTKNVLVRDGAAGDVRIIDLEAAWEEGVDRPLSLTTPGFTNPTQKSTDRKENDFYALGAVMLATLFPINGLIDIEPSKKNALVEAFGNDLGLAEPLQYLIERCMHNDVAERPASYHLIEIMQRVPVYEAATSTNRATCALSKEELRTTIEGVTAYIRASADTRRNDRLFPADPMVFITNPLSVAYGAMGVAYALARIDGEVPGLLRSWLHAHPVHPSHYPPGLYVGAAGIAWTLWEIGMEDIALQTLRAFDHHPLLWDVANILYGSSGYGMTCLRFYLATRDQTWLDKAIQVGEWLLHSKSEDTRGCYWPEKEGETRLGYARGASGIALYLLYLSLVTEEEQFLETGKRALAFDLSYLRDLEEECLGVPRGTVGSFENVCTQYWINGSAGVATALVRFWAYTGDSEYLPVLKHLSLDTCRKYTAFPGLFQGLSGLGNFLLDAYEFTGKERYLQQAYQAANSVLLYKLQRPGGIAFPGEQLFRISTDFATGSAGIALFLHRLMHADKPVGNFNFTLDQFFPQHSDRSGQVVAKYALNKELK
jgi:tRNA A-37 threonylcarbamoyl transferase component Bud32